MRIFLTGGSGYLGLHVLGALLDAGHEVTALVRSPARLGPFARHERVSARCGDLLDAARVSAEVVGHQACVHAALIWGAPGTELELLDAVAAVKLFDAAGRAGVGRTLLVSSTAVHRPFSPVMSEADALVTADIYGATKACAELLLRATCATHGMRGVVLRAGPIVGPPAYPEGAFRSDRRLEALVASARRGEPLQVPRGGRQFVAVSDVARAVTALITAPQADGVYLCVAREFTTWASIARQILAITSASSALCLPDESAADPPAWFDGRRLTALLGEPLDSRSGMTQHLAQLVQRASIEG